jgi:hypothetical protein
MSFTPVRTVKAMAALAHMVPPYSTVGVSQVMITKSSRLMMGSSLSEFACCCCFLLLVSSSRFFFSFLVCDMVLFIYTSFRPTHPQAVLDDFVEKALPNFAQVGFLSGKCILIPFDLFHTRVCAFL